MEQNKGTGKRDIRIRESHGRLEQNDVGESVGMEKRKVQSNPEQKDRGDDRLMESQKNKNKTESRNAEIDGKLLTNPVKKRSVLARLAEKQAIVQKRDQSSHQRFKRNKDNRQKIPD